MSEFDVDFAEGDEIVCSATEMLYFISEILANNGEFYIDGKTLVVTKYQPEVSPVTPKEIEIEIEEPGHPPIPELTPEPEPEPEPEIEFEKTIVVQEPTAPVTEAAEDLSPAEDLADVEVPAPVEEVKPVPKPRGRKPIKPSIDSPVQSPVEEN